MAINFFSINGTGGGGGGGGAVNTDNGIDGDGSVATPVILGGKPLIQNTVIDAAGHSLVVSNVSGINDTEVEFDPTGFAANTVRSDNGHGGNIETAVNGAGIESQVSVQTGAGAKVVSLVTDSGLGNEVIDDIDNIGLNSVTLFPVSGNPGQYAQFGNIALPPAPAPFSGSALSANHNFILLDITGFVTSAWQITAAMFSTNGVDSVRLQVTYTSFDFVNRTVFMGPASTVTGDAQYPPLTLICQPGFISVDAVVSGSDVNYDVIGTIARVGGF